MSEPRASADRIDEVVPGVWRWWVPDERIGGTEADAHAVRAGDGSVVLIDPLPVAAEPLAALGPPAAIVLTAACHQRSAWRLRGELGVPVHAPAGTREMDGEPDARYREGDDLPGDLRAVHTPGPERAHYSLLLAGARRVLFCSDLVMNPGGEGLRFVPLAYHDEPDETRRSVRRLAELDFEVLCLDHGAPVLRAPQSALRALAAA
jgi:glyoxylase-like metal-dependent hydrolase (beta-lactamase superfamily II)